MKTTNIKHVAHLIELCVNHGISKVVISPGSRNAPLIIGFDAHPNIQVYTVHDERSAAFFALGLSEATGEPVALSCTSGSAPINYAPAISEAYYRSIPLLVLTADRPVEWVDQGDGQTIRQKHLFQNFIKADFELPEAQHLTLLELSDSIVNEALNALFQLPRGPVHINIPLSEPLYGIEDVIHTPAVTRENKAENSLSIQEIEALYQEWNGATKKMILIGQMAPEELSKLALSPFLADPATAILVENCSNIQDFNSICHCIDRTLAILNEDELEGFAPDLLITIGGAVISKKIKTFLRKHKPKIHWRIGHYHFEEDTYRALTKSIVCHPNEFFKLWAERDLNPLSTFGNKWKQRDFMAEEAHDVFLSETTFSDLKVFEFLLDTIPEKANLHMANSSVVRYAQLFNSSSDIHYYANRGVSGIDGSTSTAVGIAVNTPDRLNLFISGDTSFFYDSNALWNAYLPSNLRIVVINNGGGGIFNIIDGPSSAEQNQLFVAPFEANVQAICQAFNVHYLCMDSFENADQCLHDFYTIPADNRPILLEIDTRQIRSEKLLKAYFERIRRDA